MNSLAPLILYDIDTERAVLGCCLLNKDALAVTVSILKPDDFYSASHRAAYDIIASMYYENVPVDHVTFRNECKKRGLFDRLGGNLFVIPLLDGVSSTANAEQYARSVRELSVRRKVLAAGQSISDLAADTSKPLPVLLQEAEKLLFDACQNTSSSDAYHIGEAIASAMTSVTRARENKPSNCYPTKWSDLDDLLDGGLKPGSLNIIAARPSMGKTAFALNIAQFGGNNPKIPVLIFSLEMPREQLAMRMIAAQSGVSLSRLSKGMFDTSEFQEVKSACTDLTQHELYINDATQLSALEFRAICRKFKVRYPELGLVIVDYLQLMSSGERRTEGRQQEVSDISRTLKAVARELNCPVLALSQLSRSTEQRTDKKPQLSDLRDSGAIEQDADTVIMLYRQDYYSDSENNPLRDSEADVRVAKNRNGSTGMMKLTFRREVTKFLSFGEL